MEKHSPAYYRARLELISELIRTTPDDGSKNNAQVLLRNGIILPALLHGKTEKTVIEEQMKAIRFSNAPLSFSELCRWNTWFAMHPEKVAGTEVITTSFEFPVTIKGTKEDIINVLTPVVSEDNIRRVRLVKAKAMAKLKLLELTKL